MIDRNKKLAIIHIARKQCGLDDNSYRSLLSGSAGVESAKKIETEAQYRKVIEAFKSLGFKSTRTKRKISDPQIAKCYALWCELFKVGAVKNKKYSALMSWIERQLGNKQDIITATQKSALIEDLKNWLDRVKVKNDRKCN